MTTEDASRATAATLPTGFEERTAVSGLTAPTSVAWAPDGRMFVADTNNKRIQQLDPAGHMVAEWPLAGWQGGTRNEPYLALDSAGNVLVTDPPGSRIVKFSPTGEPLAVAGVAAAFLR